MACFIAPTTAALITSAIKKKVPARYHIEWLLTMLWGGVAWLIPEHIYHGEVVFYPPFFTKSASGIIPEIIRVGIPMALITIAVWASAVAIVTVYQNNKFRLSLISWAIYGAAIMILVDRLFA